MEVATAQNMELEKEKSFGMIYSWTSPTVSTVALSQTLLGGLGSSLEVG
jgi:hypothetical protein